MTDDLTNRGPVRWWTKELGITEAKLRAAVSAVGVSSSKVKIYLSLPRKD